MIPCRWKNKGFQPKISPGAAPGGTSLMGVMTPKSAIRPSCPCGRNNFKAINVFEAIISNEIYAQGWAGLIH